MNTYIIESSGKIRDASSTESEYVLLKKNYQNLLEIAYTTNPRDDSQISLYNDKDETNTDLLEIIQPPIDPEALSLLLRVDNIHYRCCRTKVSDTVCRQFDILPHSSPAGLTRDGKKTVLTDAEKKQIVEARQFLQICNDIDNFEGVIDKAAMDYESIGYCGIAVRRSLNGKIAKIWHIPAVRLKVRSDRRVFIDNNNGKETYYQLFGDKVKSKKRKIGNQPENYDPVLDGELKASNFEWNFLKKDGKKGGTFLTSIDELLFIRKFHPSTVCYGIPDVVPAIHEIIANLHIKEYFIKFFQNSAMPEYAIIIKGGKLTEELKRNLENFFKHTLRNENHKTLILPINTAASGKVEVEFVKLNTDEKEGSFQETRKNNNNAIITAHGLSPSVLGVADNASLGSGKGDSQSNNYKNRVIIPNQLRWSKELTKLIRLGLGLSEVRLEFEPLDISDMEQEKTVYIDYLKSGVLTINQVREAAKLGDPIEGGDRAFIMVGSDLFFIDDMSKAPSTLLEKLENTKKALDMRANGKDAPMNEQDIKRKQNDREVGTASAEETGLPQGS